jgi:hypothetical protein
MTYREIAYACLDSLKLASDDSYITLEHVLFYASKVRGLILKQRYADIKKEIPSSNYQTICLDLIQVPAISGEPCEGGVYLRSKEKIPSTMSIGNSVVYPVDFYQGTHITFVSRERMRYTGHNKWLQNIIYASKGPDDYLYFKSSNPQFLYLEKVQMTAIFEDPEEASKLSCTDDGSCDILDMTFPLEEALVSSVIELIVKYLSGIVYKPKDEENNASDDMSDLVTYIRRNMKSDFLKQIENG